MPIFFPGTSRVCDRCSTEKALTDFGADASTCKSCGGLAAAADAVRTARVASENHESALDPSLDDVKHLIGWGTALEAEVAEAFVECGGDVVRTATAMGTAPSVIRARLRELQRAASRRGWAPGSDMTKPVPEGFHVKGVSTFYGADGELRGQWVKTQVDQEHRLEALMRAVREQMEPLRGAIDPVPSPQIDSDDLLNVIPIGDPHLGLHAWAEESGENFDLKIAEQDLCDAITGLLERAPKARTCMVVSLGDLFHSDNSEATTTRGTRVDVDSRWSKVLAVGVRTIRTCIDRALETHERVRFVPVCGNHDAHTSAMLGIAISLLYEREPRVEIDVSPSKFHYYRHGKVLFGMTHGDTAKKEQLGPIMAVDRREDWGQTEHRYWLTGHIHHESAKEFPGVIVESFRTLAPKDAWHAASGYRSGRDIRLDTYHAEFGHVDRRIHGISYIRFLQSQRDSSRCNAR